MRWLFPYSRDDVPERVLATSEGLAVDFLETGKSVYDTLSGLLAAVETHEWVFWCTSDRYPIAIRSTAELDHLVAGMGAGEFDAFEAVKLTRWRELQSLPASAVTVRKRGVDFLEHQPGVFGFWHPHFVKTGFPRQSPERTVGRGHAAPAGPGHQWSCTFVARTRTPSCYVPDEVRGAYDQREEHGQLRDPTPASRPAADWLARGLPVVGGVLLSGDSQGESL